MYVSKWSQVLMSAKSAHPFPIEGFHGKQNSTLINFFNIYWSFFAITSGDTEPVSAPLSYLTFKWLGKTNE